MESMNDLVKMIGGIAGASFLAMLTAILMGKTLKTLVYWTLKALASRTSSTSDDKLVEMAREDLGLPPESKEKE